MICQTGVLFGSPGTTNNKRFGYGVFIDLKKHLTPLIMI